MSPVSILCRFWNDISLKPRRFKTGRNLGTALAYLPFSIEKETEVSSRAQAWKWQATPVLLPVKSHGWRSLVGYSPWGSKNQTWLSDYTSLSLSLPRLRRHFSCIHSSRFLLKNVWSLSAALLWLSSLEATEVLTPIFHGGGVCLYHVMALLTEGGTGLPRNVRAFQTPGATITLYHHFPLSGHLLWVQIHLNYFPSYFYWPAVEIYWTSNVYLSFPYHIDNTTYYCPFSYSLVKHSWAK